VVEESNKEKKVNLDLLDEVREEARIKAEALKRRVELQAETSAVPGRRPGDEEGPPDRDQIREDFTNGGRGHSPKHLKFFLLVF